MSEKVIEQDYALMPLQEGILQLILMGLVRFFLGR